MHREVRRETKLPAFSIALADLELMMDRLAPLFPEDDVTHTRISIDLPGEKLSFTSVQEMQAHAFSQAKVHSFSIYKAGGHRSLMLLTPSVPLMWPALSTSGESEVWCAGANEVVVSLVGQNKVWHHWLRPGLIAVVALLFSIGGAVLLGRSQAQQSSVSAALALGYIGSLTALSVLLLGRNRLLPPATLRLSDRESWIRAHLPELTLLVAAVSAALTAIGLLLGRGGA
jgi:hypothetical protein